jgi:hypothetical protein
MHGLSVNEPVLEHEGVDSVLDFGSSAINRPFHERQVALAPRNLSAKRIAYVAAWA